MFDWLKNLFKNPKVFIKMAVDSLDLLVPTLANEIEKIAVQFNAKTSNDKAQWLIDEVQSFLRKKFSLDD